MNRLFRLGILLSALLMGYVVQAQEGTAETRRFIREGNRQYASGEFVEAEVSYKKALESESRSVRAAFNLGDALYEQERFEDAGESFRQAAQLAESSDVQARAYHNLGNSFLKAQQYEQSIEAYKQALRRNPRDEDTRYNLAYALQQLRQQQQQDQQNQDEDQDQQDQEQNEDENQDQQDQQNQDQQNQDQQQQDQQKQQQQQPQDAQQQQGQQQQKMSPQEIEQMLEALRYQEQKLREEMQKEKAKGQPRKSAKDGREIALLQEQKIRLRKEGCFVAVQSPFIY